jgi:adenylate cyclase
MGVVYAVLTGTFMRVGDQIRVNAQLLEAPGGTVLWSESSQSPLGDLFAVQDGFTQRLVAALTGQRSKKGSTAKWRPCGTPRGFSIGR